MHDVKPIREVQRLIFEDLCMVHIPFLEEAAQRLVLCLRFLRAAHRSTFCGRCEGEKESRLERVWRGGTARAPETHIDIVCE
jgi:hypothetical protein